MAIFNLILYLHNNFVLFYSVLFLCLLIYEKQLKYACLHCFFVHNERNNDRTEEWNAKKKYIWIQLNVELKLSRKLRIRELQKHIRWLTDHRQMWQVTAIQPIGRHMNAKCLHSQNIVVHYLHLFCVEPGKLTFGDRSDAISCQLQIFHRLDIYLVHTVFCIDVRAHISNAVESLHVTKTLFVDRFWLQNAHHPTCAAERRQKRSKFSQISNKLTSPLCI